MVKLYQKNWKIHHLSILEYQIFHLLMYQAYYGIIVYAYYGIIVYADDIFLLCPTREGLQTMMNVCQKFAAERNLKFSVSEDIKKSKTKCIIFTKKKLKTEHIVPIYLDGKQLPYVDSLNHLGNTVQSGKVTSLNQEFYFCSPDIKSKLYNIYCCSFYGSSLWDLHSYECEKLYKSFNVAIRISSNIPRNSHRYLIEELIGFPHPKVMLCARFVNFHKSLTSSKKQSIRLLAKLCSMDEKSRHKKNLSQIGKECNEEIKNLTPSIVKKNMNYYRVPSNEEWRIPLLQNLLMVRAEKWFVPNFEDQELADLIHYVCTT